MPEFAFAKPLRGGLQRVLASGRNASGFVQIIAIKMAGRNFERKRLVSEIDINAVQEMPVKRDPQEDNARLTEVLKTVFNAIAAATWGPGSPSTRGRRGSQL